jgi:hypothetical protein
MSCVACRHREEGTAWIFVPECAACAIKFAAVTAGQEHALMTRPVSPCWIVHSVGSAVEIVYVGAPTADLEAAINRVIRAMAYEASVMPRISMIGIDPTRPTGIRVEDFDADTAWRLMVYKFGDDTKVDSARVLLAINRIQYAGMRTR